MIMLFLFHAFYASGIGFVLSALFGQLTPWIAGVSLASAFWPALKTTRAFVKDEPGYRFSAFSFGEAGMLELVMFSFLIFASYRNFMWLLFDANHSWMTLLVNNLGDLPLHINYIRLMANGAHFPPINPGFPYDSLHYPFAPDFYNALWESLGLRLTFHLFFTGMLASVASLVLLRRYGGWWAIGAFFFNGGIFGWSCLTGVPIYDWQSKIDWKNFFVTVFIPQRGFLFALPAGLFLLIEARRHLLERELKGMRAIAFALVWGLLPFFHAHAFVAVSLMIGGMVLIEKGWRGVIGFFSRKFMFIAYIVATYFVWRASNGFEKSGVIHWSFAWTSTPRELPSFLWKNFGPWLAIPVLIPITLYLRRKHYDAVAFSKLISEWLLCLGLFILFFNLMLAPWAWDNVKVLIWPYLGLSRVSYIVFEPLFSGRGQWFRVPAAGILFLSGFLSVSCFLDRPSTRGTVIYQTTQLAETEGAISGIDMNAIFAAAPTFNHTLTYFGRVRVMDYEGHMWSHGIDYLPTQAKLDRLMNGDAAWRSIASDLRVSHIFWGPSEKQTYGDIHPVWMDQLKNISRVPGYSIFEIRP